MKKVLIIDDDNKNIFALSATLRSKGYKTLAATSAEDGLKLIEDDGAVDVVLMDMMMPEMDGYEAIHVLRNTEDHKTLPVIAVTAQAMKGDREKCLAAGANGYISKPVDVDMLVGLLQELTK